MDNIKSSRSYILTVSCDKVNFEDLQELLKEYIYIGQQEKAESGFLHYQIYIENKSPIRFDTLKNKLPTAHIEKRRGTKQQAYDYVTKLDTRIGEIFQNGEIDLTEEQGKRNDIEKIRNAILIDNLKPSDIILQYKESGRLLNYIDRLNAEKLKNEYSEKIRDLKVTYIWGEPGTGKTRHVYNKHGFKDVYRITNYKYPFDSYNFQDVIVFDEFHSQIMITEMLNFLDIYPLELPCRYQNKQACYNQVYIISNIPLENQYPNIQLSSKVTYYAFLRRIHNTIKYPILNEIQEKIELPF